MATDVLPGLTKSIIGSAIQVHRTVGPGLLEGTYRACLVHQLRKDGMSVRHEVPIKVKYDGVDLDVGYRADLIVHEQVLLELKSVETLLPVHEAQLLTYLRHSGLKVGLLMNFNVARLVEGLRRFVN